MRSLLLAAFITVPLLGTSCVSQSRYDDIEKTNSTLRDQLSQLQTEIAGYQRQIATLKDQIAAYGNSRDQNAAEVARLRQELAAAQSSIAALNNERDSLSRQVDELALQDPIVIVQGGPLTEEANNVLQQLAADNPGLMTYDAQQGMIRLASDVTFALGSADVNDEAKQALSQLADILNRNDLSGFNLEIVGHTDSEPVRNPSTVARYGENMGLSCGRALGVMRELRAAGIRESRMAAVGVGEYQPVVANNTTGGTPANRRVEIYITEQAYSGPSGQSAEATEVQPIAPAQAEHREAPSTRAPEPADDSRFK